jgi:hypothetical protein
VEKWEEDQVLEGRSLSQLLLLVYELCSKLTAGMRELSGGIAIRRPGLID